MARYFSTTFLAGAFAAAGGLVQAQDVCGGSGSGGQWIGGAEGASDIATADSHAEQMALVLSGAEHVTLFSLSAPSDVRIEAAGRGNGDPTITILDGSGNEVASDDDSGGNGAARAELSLDAGTYCVNMVSYTGAPMTAFVRIGRTEHEALTEGVTESGGGGDSGGATESVDVTGDCASARDMGTLSDSLSATGAVEEAAFWRFSLGQAQAISITASNEDADPVITLYDVNEEYLAENDDHDGLNSRIDMTSDLPAGDYCIQVDALNDVTQPIEIVVTGYDPQAALEALYLRGEAAPALGGDIPITDLGEISSRTRQDVPIGEQASWFAFDIPQAGLIVAEAIGAGGGIDPWIVLYDDLGRQIGLNDDTGDGLDSLVAVRVNAGTYLLAVKDVGGGQGFARLVLERFVPAQ